MKIQPPKIGDAIMVGGQIRTVVGIERNTIGDPILLWESSRESGACVCSLWDDWKKGERTDY